MNGAGAMQHTFQPSGALALYVHIPFCESKCPYCDFNTYAGLDIPEYWRFDETGQFHGTRLAGDRLVDGQYEPIPIDELPDGSLQGHSAILNVDVRWVDGHLVWYDPTSGEPVATFESLRQAFARESEALTREREALNQEREARIQAETRVRELEDQIRRLRGE